MIRHVFIFGVVLPTLITIAFFVGFLICWFKFSQYGWWLWNKRKGGSGGGAGAFSASEVNSTQKIVQFGQDEEELDNEKNQETDKFNCTDDRDPDGPGLACGGGSGSSSTGGRSVSKYVITPHQVEYHYQQNVPLSNPPEHHVDVGDNKGPCSVVSEAGGVCNDALCISPSMELEPDTCELELHQGELLVQHTFHFPKMTSYGADSRESHRPKEQCPLEAEEEERCQFYGDSDEDSDTENYGHFVPLSEVKLEIEKKKQLFKACGGAGCGEAHPGHTRDDNARPATFQKV